MDTARVVPAASAALLVVLCVGAVAYARHVPAVVPASAPLTVFSGQRALVDVLGVARPPSAVGGARNRIARDYIETQLRAGTLPYQEQRTVAVGTRYSVAGPITNILVRLPGTQSSGPAVLLMAHYDAVPMSPGAGDDGSGSAVLLETLRALRAGPPPKHDVIALFTDGEESGLLGAAAFVREHPWARDVAVVLNFEARGTHGPSLMFETGPGNLDVVRQLRRVPGARATSLSTAVYRRLPNDTDLSELAVLGTPALNFAFIGGVERYHTAEDDVAHLDARSLQQHGRNALALARLFANGDLPRPRTSDAVFFDFPGLGLIVYPERWAIAFGVIAVVLALFALVLLRRRMPRVSEGVVVGLVATLIAPLLAAVVSAAIAALLQRLHGSSAGGGNPAWSAVYAAALATSAFAVASWCVVLTRKIADVTSVSVGALLCWTLLSLLLSFALPGASFVFTWPAIAMGVAALVRARWTHWSTSIMLWIGVAAVVFMIGPVVYLMAYQALGVDVPGAAILAVLIGAATMLVSPILDAMGHGRPSRAAIGATGIALVSFAIGAITVRTSGQHPGAAGLIYAVDADSNTAWLTGYATSPSARQAVLGVLRHAGEGRAETGRPPAWVGRSFGDKSIIGAPLLDLVAPSVTVLSDASTNGTRHSVLHIRPGMARHAIYVTADTMLVTALTVDGRPVERRRFRSQSGRWNLQYVSPPDSGFTVELTLAPGAHGTLSLRGVALGIPPSSEFRLPRRPEHILPIQNGDMTWIYKRFAF